MSFSINCLEITATKEQWVQSKSLCKNLLSEEDYKQYAEKNPNPSESFKKRFFFYLHHFASLTRLTAFMPFLS